MDAGFVYNDPRQGGYQVTSLVPSLSCGFQRDPLVVEAGREAARVLTRTLKWPASIALFDNYAIVVRHSTAPDSPFAPFHSTVNMRLSLATRALGRAFLAFCDDAEIETIAGILGASDDDEDRHAFDRHRFRCLLKAIRDRGFAERCPQIKPQTSTIAVPILYNDQVMASLGLTYFTSAVEPREAHRRFIPHMHRARETIEMELSRLAAGAGPVGRPA